MAKDVLQTRGDRSLQGWPKVLRLSAKLANKKLITVGNPVVKKIADKKQISRLTVFGLLSARELFF